MAAPTLGTPTPGQPDARAEIPQKTLRQDRWWLQPTISGSILVLFVAYSTWAAFQNSDYYYHPYLSPFYSPCIASVCDAARNGSAHSVHVPNVGIVGTWWPISASVLVLIVPLGFRLTCYYYRRAYYRAFWQSPPNCAVREPHKRYTGETRFPLIFQNVHRYFFYLGLLLNGILTYDAVVSFQSHGHLVARGVGAQRHLITVGSHWGHVGLGTVVLCINAVLLWSYSLSCHSCRHIVGGRLKHFSKHPIRFKFWGFVSKLNSKHMQIAWGSLVWVALTDVYVRLAASGTLGHGSWI